MPSRSSVTASFVAAAALLSGGCHDLSGFSTGAGSFEGPVVQAAFVRAGVDASARLCLSLDTEHLQDAPGALSTSDGRFHSATMRTIPQIWQDPLSTLTFGEGRVKNLVYVAAATTPFADGQGNDVLVVLSLMQFGGVEARLIRSAPAIGTASPSDGAAQVAGQPSNVFAVFDLNRQSVPCSY
jgi:hypothetical protein